MRRGQRVPRQWLIVAHARELGALARIPCGTGVLALKPLPAADRRRLRLRGLVVVREGRHGATRVHNVRELRRALLARTPMILLSPIFPTRSHPDWQPIPRMRASALARLGGRKLFALGGIDARKFAQLEQLGFQGWAGISAFRT